MATFQSDPPANELQGRRYASCDCFAALHDSSRNWSELTFHDDAMSEHAAGQIVDLVKMTADKGLKVFAPRKELGWELWAQVTRLPQSIQFLESVETLDLYGSHLVSIPREVLFLKRLKYFDAYTSYRLHWLPYEIARCPLLSSSRLSTRALYGNYKYRPPFPRLPNHLVAQSRCSVCDGEVAEGKLVQRWITLRVGTDMMPLLVNACSGSCLEKLPAPPAGVIDRPHKGGLSSRPPRTPRSYR